MYDVLYADDESGAVVYFISNVPTAALAEEIAKNIKEHFGFRSWWIEQ